MATYLGFQSNQCKDCYSCLRKCPVKAIKIKENKAIIVDDMCVLCGSCIHVCPQNAKYIIPSVDKVKKLIRGNQGRVVLSVAPSFIGNFEVDNFAQMKDVARKLGFITAEETSVGAYYVTKEYERIIEEGGYTNMITTACPSVVDMITKYYPQYSKYLIPVDSPAIAHAKYLRKKYGDSIKVVFVGPCIAKKKELVESGEVDAVLTFQELLDFMDERNVFFDRTLMEEAKDYNPARFYSINRGIIKSLNKTNEKWEYIGCDGAAQCKEVLDGLDNVEHVFIEMNMCEFGCINGPVNVNTHGPAYATGKVRKFTKSANGNDVTLPKVDLSLEREYPAKPIEMKLPTDEEMAQILAKIGKYKKADEINCKACGYDTCRDKAIAVYNRMSDENFCMPYMKNIAESISNEIIAHTPNGIVSVDNNLNIIEMNKSMMAFLGFNGDVSGRNFDEFVFIPEFREAIETGEDKNGIVAFIPETQMYFDVSITALTEHNMGFAIFKDRTLEIEKDEKLKAMRENMINLTDEVIDKQMRVVQEIASLLGETTAETKIALVKFRNTLKDNDD